MDCPFCPVLSRVAILHTAPATALTSLDSCPGQGHYKEDTRCEIPAVVKVKALFVFLLIL